MSNYGGIRLALQKGDQLKIRLVNRLPPMDPVKVTHSVDPGGANLPMNLTNLHTHGLVVQARAPTLSDPTFGDYIFVEIYNSANGTPVPQTTHQHGSLVKDYADYRIDIPANHPSGAFWFHPHVHGIALNQVSSGLSGIISIGKAGDYAKGDQVKTAFPDASVRHLVLKDLQVLAGGNIMFDNGPANVVDGEVLSQQDPDFCTQIPADPSEIRQGSCPGTDNSPDGNNYVGGTWFFTVSGQQFPSQFDPSVTTVCLPLGTGQTPVHETWELVNLATENHNFHMHQTKFRFIQSGAPVASIMGPTANQSLGAGIMEDNVPLPVSTPNIPDVADSQNGYCTIDQWHNGQCTSVPLVVDIPFAQLGEFVFHCHILEHEDGGMMARIQVVPAPR